MIRPLDMVKATLFGHIREREAIITRLHKHGFMQLVQARVEELKQSPPLEDLREISDILLRVSHCNSILKLAPRKLTLKMRLYGLETPRKLRVRRATKEEKLAEARAFLDRYEKQLLALEDRHLKAQEELSQYREYRDVILLLQQHNIPVEMLGETEHVSFTIGELPTQNIDALQRDLRKDLKERCHIETRQASKKSTVLVIITLKEDMARVNFLSKKYGLQTFAFRQLPPMDRPRAWVEEELGRREEAITQTLQQIAEYQAAALDHSICIRERLELLKERYEAFARLKQSERFFLLQGWVTKRELSYLERAFPDCAIVAEEPKQDEEPPVRLSNPRWLRPFEMLTELYALPKYKDLDPTFIVAPLFLLYAGFMLTDFVYGFGLVLLGSTIYLLFRKQQSGMRDISLSIFFIGLVSMFFGVLTGSYLGDAPSYFFGLPTEQLAIWADPLKEPMYFLILSLGVGLAHLNVGLILGAIEDIRKRDWKELVKSRGTWWLLQVTVLCFVLGLQPVAWMLAVATLGLILWMHGLLGLLGATGFMGDVISYSRLFALALSTAGIAMTVNLLADMLAAIPYVGILLAALIFITGHLFSFAMNSLGSFVHSIRLQFVEFFNKFYEGGGEKFIPFKEERVYTEADE